MLRPKEDFDTFTIEIFGIFYNTSNYYFRKTFICSRFQDDQVLRMAYTFNLETLIDSLQILIDCPLWNGYRTIKWIRSHPLLKDFCLVGRARDMETNRYSSVLYVLQCVQDGAQWRGWGRSGQFYFNGAYETIHKSHDIWSASWTTCWSLWGRWE